MRSLVLVSLLITCLVTLVYAWSEEDHEIFRLRDEVELHEGEGITFYDFVGVKTGFLATQEDINKAYKKQSIRLHPDKHKPASNLTPAQARTSQRLASERFSRLSLVRTILTSELRERYDHFLKNGFPRWRGTGYYYVRFRPGIGSVLVGLALASAVAHYAILALNARQQRAFMQRYIRYARTAAWGEAGVPGLADFEAHQKAVAEGEPVLNRAQRRLNKVKKTGGSGTSTPVPSPNGAGKRRVVAENGKVFIVDSLGDVYLESKDEDGNDVQDLLDLKGIEGPKIRNTFLVRVPVWAFAVTVGRFLTKSAEEVEEEEESGSGSGSGSGAEEVRRKGVARKVESRGGGVPRRKVTQRAKKQK